MKVGFGIGLLLCFLIPIALLLFSVIDVAQTASLVFLMAGLWAVTFGVAFAGRKDKLYQIGFGVVVAVISSFIVLPLQYTAGLVVLSIIGVVLASIAERPKTSQQIR